MTDKQTLISSERIKEYILLIRGHKVILDRDLAQLYEVTTGNLNKAVTRNIDRFPSDFAFRLTPEEYQTLRFQFGSLKRGQHAKYPPRVFTEQGVAMLSSVLKSKRAALVNVAIMRTFVQLREMLATHKDLARKLNTLEQKYDAQFKVVFDAIRQLMTEPEQKKRKIGFKEK